MTVFLVSSEGELDSAWRGKRKALARARELACIPGGISEARFRHCVSRATAEAKENETTFACVVNPLAGPGPYVTIEEWPVG